MKSKRIIALGVMGMLMAIPTLASAEETSVGARAEISVTGSAGGSITPPAPPASADSWSFGESNPQSPPLRAGEGKIVPPRPIRESPTLLRESPSRPSLAPRDAATGQSSGKRMMASGTIQLQPGMTKRMGERDEMMDHRMGSGTPRNEKMLEKMEERHEELNEKMEERKGEMLKRMSTQMIAKMKAAVERFTKLSNRVDSRIAKLKAKGVVTTTAEANIAIVRTKIAEATAAISSAESSIAAAVASANTAETSGAPTSSAKPVRDALKAARTAVEAAHKALVNAIESLKANVKSEVGTTPTATTTAT